VSGIHDVIIIGAGPAGLTAALYTCRARLDTLIIEKETIGGELMNRDLIENYPGYPGGISGPELGSKMMTQAMDFGGEIQIAEVEGIEVEKNYTRVKTTQGQYLGRAIILSGGARPKKLGVPGEVEFTDKGVFYCATCDGPRFADRVVAVAGAGDSGITEALFLTQFVSKVIVVETLLYPSACKMLQERAFSNPKIEVRCDTRIEAICGDDQVKGLALVNIETGKSSTLEVDGVLVHVGLDPNTGYLRDVIRLDEKGQIFANERMETPIPGVFAAGDVRHHSPMQIASAVGDGATAALSLERYLKTL
jgi:thioredoxin reductase (NADPH)